MELQRLHSIVGNRVAQEGQPHKERCQIFGTKGSQVPRHLPSTITDSHLSSFSTHIEYGQTILKSEYRRNAGHSIPNPLPEAKESWAPSQIPRNIKPTNTYTHSECLYSKSTAPPHGPSKALPKPSPTKSKQNGTSTSHASSPAVSAYWTGRSVDFPTQPTTT